MSGYARDENTAPIAGVDVIVVSASRTARTHTDARGFFAFIDLPPDVYTVSVEKVGFAPHSTPGARVNSDQTTFLAFTMIRWSCGGHAYVVEQRSDDFTSLDLRALSAYPPQLRFLWIPVPHASMGRAFMCL